MLKASVFVIIKHFYPSLTFEDKVDAYVIAKVCAYLCHEYQIGAKLSGRDCLSTNRPSKTQGLVFYYLLVWYYFKKPQQLCTTDGSFEWLGLCSIEVF
jgi:hypothetical protein